MSQISFWGVLSAGFFVKNNIYTYIRSYVHVSCPRHTHCLAVSTRQNVSRHCQLLDVSERVEGVVASHLPVGQL